ncbi:MAG: PHP domain-containing protein [Vicinamibacterales bacterium]
MRILAHAHTTWSHDGHLALDEWVAVARQRRIAAVLFSEHEESGWTAERYARYAAACRCASTSDVALIPGIEFLQDGCHVLAFGLAEWPRRPCSAAELAAQVEAQGSFLCLAHPGKYRWRIPTGLVAAAAAVEVWNSKWIYDGTLLGPHHRSLRLGRGKRLLAGQDVHRLGHLTSLFIETAGSSILADLRAGRYEFEQAGRRWPAEDLAAWRLRSWLQAARFPALRLALTIHRWLRRVAGWTATPDAPAAP